ncbi:ester cyclase [uncultured Tateyamaria sp.]|uniref:ester cyclase n=1 Tax=uncultured Tateyamaria sp. TaxID=455651 RepID=UPI00263185B2|nr:ester cyclase [uncultured Tateyamaria sp.]
MKELVTLISATSLALLANVAEADTPVEIMAEFYETADERPFDPTKFAPFFADTFKDHDPQPTGGLKSGEDVATFFSGLAAGSTDSKHVIDYIVPVGDDKALVRWQFVGTHDGNMFGFPATGNAIDISGMELWEFKDGKISGLWHVEELATMFQQLKAQ